LSISKECLEKATHIYEAHEYAHAASALLARQTPEEVKRYMGLLVSELNAVPAQIPPDVDNTVKEALRYIDDKKYREAIFSLGRFLDRTKDLMFEVAVTCECKKEK